MDVTTLGIDLAKNSFHLVGLSPSGQMCLSRKLSRVQLSLFVENLPVCTIAMEACGSAFYWARKFKAMGHEIKLISPQHVKPFVKSQKNDRNDAQAIAEASLRPNMHFVATKEVWQQDLLALHRVRQRLVKAKVGLINQTRGILYEQGVAIAKGPAHLHIALPKILGDEQATISDSLKRILRSLYEELLVIREKIEAMDNELKRIARENPTCARIQQVPGVGPVTATAIVASIGDPNQFKNGRQAAAWIGLVPRQNSTGGKARLMGITKRGDEYLRVLLIVGARAVLQQLDKEKNHYLKRFKDLSERKHSNIAAVALANRNARVVLAMLKSGEEYRSA